MSDVVSRQIWFLVDQQFFFFGRVLTRFELVLNNSIARRNYILTRIDLADQFRILRMDQGEFQFRHARKLFARLLNLRRVETGDLYQNAIVPDRTDDRLADAKIIDSFTDHFDCLVEHSLVHVLVASDKANEERSAALNIETELDLLLRRPDPRDAERSQQLTQRGPCNQFPQPNVGGEIPAQQNQQTEPCKKCHRES